MLELAILIPFVLWSINEAQKGRQQNERQNSDIAELHHCVDKLASEVTHHRETAEIRIASISDVVDKIWHKLE